MTCRALALLVLGVALVGCQTPATRLTATDGTAELVRPDRNCMEPWTSEIPEPELPKRLSLALLRAAFRGEPVCIQQLIRAGADINSRLPDGTTALGLAARQGQLEVVRALLAIGADIDLANHAGVTALTAAAGNGQDATVSELLQAGADVRQVTIRGWSALHHAVAGCHLGPAELLLAKGVDVDGADHFGNTALLLAAAVCPRAMALLLDHGANIEHAEIQGMTALLVAAQNGNAETVDLLLARGADAGHRDQNGRNYQQWTVSVAPPRSMAR